ncbi:hypothetical protein GYMLUDRAFT_450575 [Collybiopsis luxurians FD-317 M1]|uniref:Unplaced genomic scaffold GYMLUscaffold_15, whole genome shotgun sequence n=1 Tax=Collybiopsis luxurians FD-317 M1 TaxID=944289 RepID=A0A0D0CVK8_9AGAR|nr:hypothetical protein GYMLUDRAFT_450575 [Collybiopsis luxurians FD-317 M1]
MIPMSNSSNLDRRRHAHSQRQGLVRSNSSLLGSIKNFVAAPFSRLFTGSANEFDDPNDISGKRRLIVNTEVDNNDIVEDGPAPAKRMRVRSPEPESPPRSAGYLDPPGSAFQLGNHNNLSNNPPSRSASISVPSTVPDPSAYNARSTISPLRNHFSRNMSIDSIPSHQPRPLSRDITMKSLSSIPGDRSVSIRAGSRDSLPPPFRLRDSLTPQPHKSMVRQPNRDVSEPPPMTALHSKPVFVRGPSQVLETPQPSQSVATLGSLVDSQRSLRSPSRQRTLLFGPSQPPVDSQAAAAERTLHELEFYKTPLVPTRIRSRMPNSVAASASSSNITDMFARKHSLILMGDHDRPSRGSKRDKKKKGKGKEGKESNETKPYAGTTGIRKRLAKAKDINEKSTSQEATVVEKVNDSPPTARGDALPEIPVPPPKEKDIFNVVPFPSASTPAHQSSLRVGRAARSHLSRPIKKFSATYDDDEDKVTDETKKDLEMLEEAAKKVPVFEIPAGFTFAKEVGYLFSPRFFSHFRYFRFLHLPQNLSLRARTSLRFQRCPFP